MKEKVICIVGPTASGKSSLAIELAKRINGEIISADSMQVYRKLDIGTAKITKEEMQGINHYLIDVVDINDSFSVSDYKCKCYDAINKIHQKNKTAIIAGGTGLYINSVVYNMDFGVFDIDQEFRNNLYDLALKNGNEFVWSMLNDIDSKTANQIHPNNLKRVIRAIEIAKFSDKSKSEHMEEENKRIKQNNIPYDFYIFYIDFNRETLYNRINIRIDEMIEMGLVNEARMVYDMNLNSDATCMQAIGYKEFFPYFEGTSQLPNCIDKLKQETRNYAKRQMTWFKNKLDIFTLNGEDNKEKLVKYIIDTLNLTS